ncbi:MAG: hypothetical protein KAS32_21790 [Candidatus Peribacteraceae bacterium]|nr:hypothetical protein [Candidatus Peribacteraceae bacterium]
MSEPPVTPPDSTGKGKVKDVRIADDDPLLKKIDALIQKRPPVKEEPKDEKDAEIKRLKAANEELQKSKKIILFAQLTKEEQEQFKDATIEKLEGIIAYKKTLSLDSGLPRVPTTTPDKKTDADLKKEGHIGGKVGEKWEIQE